MNAINHQEAVEREEEHNIRDPDFEDPENIRRRQAYVKSQEQRIANTQGDTVLTGYLG